MKIGPFRLPVLLLAFLFVSPGMLVSRALAQDSNLFAQAWNNLGATFFIIFLLMILAGITLIIFNSIAIRRKAFIKDDVIEPIMQEIQNLNIDGAKALCDQYKLPVTSVLKAGLERIQDDELPNGPIDSTGDPPSLNQ